MWADDDNEDKENHNQKHFPKEQDKPYEEIIS